MLSGVEDVRWDETLGQLVIQGDIVRLTGFTDANGQTLPMDLGATKVRIVAQRLSIESDLVAGALVLDVSERLTLDGDLLRHGDNVKFDLARVIPADRAPQIVAHMAIQFRAMRLGGRLITVAGLGDVATDPAHRGQGLAGRNR